MKIKSIVQGLALCACLALCGPVYASVGVSLVGGVTSSTPRISSNIFEPRMGMAAGAAAALPLGSNFELELGALYAQRKYAATLLIPLTGAKASVVTTQTMLQAPMILRFWPVSFLGIGAGGYYSRYIGDISNELTVSGVSSTVKTKYEASGMKTQDAGVVGDLEIKIPLAPTLSLLVDGRYTRGLINNARTGDAVKFEDLQGFVGVRFN